jgi:short chain dehydrogenase
VGSALGYRSIPLQSAYCGAKHAVNGFTESVRAELMHDHSNVHITIAQMPAVNTPQFSWVRSRLPRHPQPVPPIYQPEVAAQGVAYAADHPEHKEYWVGASTVGTIFAQKFAAPLLDRYVARTGYSSQQDEDMGALHGPGNLWHPEDKDAGQDHGAHGVFDDKAARGSVQLWVAQHIDSVASSATSAVGSAVSKAMDAIRGGNGNGQDRKKEHAES